jgi:hypothetical protein
MKGRGECKPSGSFDCDAQKTRVSAQDDAFGWLEGAAWDALAGQNDEQKQKQKQSRSPSGMTSKGGNCNYNSRSGRNDKGLGLGKEQVKKFCSGFERI